MRFLLFALILNFAINSTSAFATDDVNGCPVELKLTKAKCTTFKAHKKSYLASKDPFIVYLRGQQDACIALQSEKNQLKDLFGAATTKQDACLKAVSEIKAPSLPPFDDAATIGINLKRVMATKDSTGANWTVFAIMGVNREIEKNSITIKGVLGESRAEVTVPADRTTGVLWFSAPVGKLSHPFELFYSTNRPDGNFTQYSFRITGDGKVVPCPGAIVPIRIQCEGKLLDANQNLTDQTSKYLYRAFGMTSYGSKVNLVTNAENLQDISGYVVYPEESPGGIPVASVITPKHEFFTVKTGYWSVKEKATGLVQYSKGLCTVQFE